MKQFSLTLVLVLFLMLPTGLWGKGKKVPDSYFFTIEVRDALTHRSIDGAQVDLTVVKDSLNRRIAGRTNKDCVAEFTADSGADKYTFRIANNNGCQKKSVSTLNINNGAQKKSVSTFNINNGPQKKSLREYEPESVEYTISDKYKKSHHVGPVYLRHKRNINLDEVSVTASKVMFYYKGDTLIYNADAFILAEGSMLDGLISQLPGVKLNRRGEITVNGKNVDALLLNGKDIFNGKNQLMLENLAAYTVKDVAVYNKATFESKALGINAGSQYVMDVRLKRQYRHGFFGNAEAGYGTDNRYLAKLFGMWYSENAGITAFLSTNNLNDDAKPKPGYADGSWSEKEVSTGVGSYHSGGITYNAEGPDSKWKVQGDAVAKYSDGKVTRVTNTAALIPGNEIYQYSFEDSRNRDFSLNSSHQLKLSLAKRAVLALSPKIEYKHSRKEQDDVSASFNKEVEEVSRQIIENIYSGQTDFSQYLITRNLVKSLERNRRFSFNVDGNSLIRLLPNDRRAMLTVGGVANIDNRTPNLYTYRQLDFKNRPDENSSMLQHNDGSPYRDRLYKGYAKYNLSLRTPKFNFELKADYDFTRDEQTRTSQFYQGELQEDYLIPSLLPQLSVNLPLDYDESYRSRQWENKHSLNPSILIRRILSTTTNKALGMSLNVPVAISQRTLDYHCGAKNRHISSTRFLYETSASLFFQNQPKTGRFYFLNLGFKSTVRQPHLLNMVDVVDDTDPMNVILGNPELGNTRSNTVSFGLYTTGKIPGHRLSISYTFISNAISQGYYLISSTAQRISRPYNVDGNRQANVSYGISWSKSDTYWLTNTLGGGYQRSRELIGAITDSNDSPDLFVAPPTNVVNSLSLSDRLEANYNFSGKYNLRGFIDLGLRKYRSANSTFVDDLTFNGSYGVSALLNLPFNWDLSTDLTLYTRSGYSYSQLNTTDLLWNARVSKSFLKGLLVCAVDGYDLLHQLSNVSYTVNAQYRIETVTNVMPSYFLFSLQYRFNSQPQKRESSSREGRVVIG